MWNIQQQINKYRKRNEIIITLYCSYFFPVYITQCHGYPSCHSEGEIQRKDGCSQAVTMFPHETRILTMLYFRGELMKTKHPRSLNFFLLYMHPSLIHFTFFLYVPEQDLFFISFMLLSYVLSRANISTLPFSYY